MWYAVCFPKPYKPVGCVKYKGWARRYNGKHYHYPVNRRQSAWQIILADIEDRSVHEGFRHKGQHDQACHKKEGGYHYADHNTRTDGVLLRPDLFGIVAQGTAPACRNKAIGYEHSQMSGDRTSRPFCLLFKIKETGAQLPSFDTKDRDQHRDQTDGQGNGHNRIELAQEGRSIHGQQGKHHHCCNASDPHGDPQQRIEHHFSRIVLFAVLLAKR